MKLYMKQKILFFRDRFTVFDEASNPAYYVEGELLSLTKKLHIYDQNHHEVALVKQQMITFLPKFSVEVNGVEVAEIVKEISFFRPKYHIRGLQWDIVGNVFEHDYEIHDGNKTIVTIHKEWWSFSDAFVLDIEDKNQLIYALSVVLAIDCVLDAQQQANND